MRPFFGLAILLLCLAEVTAVAGDAPKDPPITVIKLQLRPAKAPVPALKHRLLPELRDLKPGNSVISYYRAFSPEWQTFQKDKDLWKWVEKWTDDKSKPPPKELNFVKDLPALAELDIGARRAYCDWEMTDRLRKDGINMMLPDIQSFRTYIVLLSARARFEMLDGKLDKSLYTLQTGFTLARHVSEGPTLIQALVGIAMTAQMAEEIEQLIQQPGAPNLYWTLTDLPTPFIDMRKSIQGEKMFIEAMFPGWRDLVADRQARPISAGEIEALVMRTQGLGDVLGAHSSDKEVRGLKLGLALFAAKSYPEGRKFLLDQGRPKQLVDEMPVTQVALLYEIHNFDRFYDDMVKWHGQPYSIMRKGVSQAEKKLKEAKANVSGGTFLATLLLPAVTKVFEASYRTDRKLAGLRCVEAIRLYAAAHEGKLPASLKDIDEVPVPVDPMTGNPFEYALTPGGATLTAPIPPGQSAYLAWRIEITMKP